MKPFLSRSHIVHLFIFLLCILGVPKWAMAQITLQLNIDQFGSVAGGNLQYGADVWLSSSNTPITYDTVTSPNGLWSSTIGQGATGFGSGFSTLGPVLSEFTNGLWTLIINGGDPSAQTNYFTVSIIDLTTNDLPQVQVLAPTNGAVNVLPEPLCEWTGAPSFTNLQVQAYNQDFSVYNSATLPVTATNWTPDNPLNLEMSQFNVDYYTYSTLVSLSTPTNQLGQPMTNWTGIGGLHVSDYSQFLVGPPPPLVARYTFDQTNNLGNDSSGENNNSDSSGGFENSMGFTYTNYSVEGGEALELFGGSWMYLPNPVLQTLEGSFSVALWLSTTNNPGDADSDSGYNGAGIVSAANQGDDCLPMVQTGNKLAFYTGDTQTTLHSATSIDTGSFVHLVVTRDIASGARKIYVNGVLDAQDLAGNDYLTNSSGAMIGYNFDGFSGFVGVVDDVQIYNAAIGDSNALYLYSNPGSIITNVPVTPELTLGQALDATNLSWTTSGDTGGWFGETTNTYDGVSAAESSLVTNEQSATLQTTVTGPAEITFWWQSYSSDQNFSLQINIDGNTWDEISGMTPWFQETPFNVGAGTHTLTWVAFGNSSDDLTAAAYVGDVSVTPIGNPPVIVSGPSNEIFYAGRAAGLQVDAGGTTPLDYLWSLDNNQLNVPNNSTLVLAYSDINTTSPYSVLVSNASGTAPSAQVYIGVTNDPSVPAPVWVRQPSPGSPTASSGAQVTAVDASGNLIVSGFFSGTNSFGTNTLIATPSAMFLAKYDSTGDCLWARNIGGGSNNYANVISMTPSGNILLGGSSPGPATIGSFVLTNAGADDAYWAEFDPNGNCLLARRFGGTGNDFVQGICQSADGSIYVAGAGDATTLGTNVLSGSNTAILAKYNSGGTVQWVIAAGGSGFTLGDDVRVLGTNVIFTGGQAFGMTFGPFSITNGGGDTFLADCDTNGTCHWLEGVGSHDVNTYTYIAFPRLTGATNTNEFYLGGQTYGSNALFGTFSIPSAAGRNAYVARFSATGACAMALIFGNTNTEVTGVQSDAADNVYTAGTFAGPTSFGDRWLMNSRGPVYSGADLGFYAASFTGAGALNWAWGSEAYTGGGAVILDTTLAVAGENDVYVGATITNAVYLGADEASAPSAGASGVFTLLSSVGQAVLLTNLKSSATNFVFSFDTQSTHSYLVEESTNLAGTVWTQYTNVAGNGTVESVTVPAAGAGHSVFYRVQTQ